MKQHKWHKVEERLPEIGQTVLSWSEVYPDVITQAYYSGNNDWQELDECGDFMEWRADYWMELPDTPNKPQPKEPQYLYVYLDDDYEFSPIPLTNKWEYIGKIKLEE
jgi:hypothetical protein